MPSILFVGGGSAGHVAPGVAVFRALHALRPDLEATFVCGPSATERAFLNGEGCEAHPFAAPRLGVSFLWRFPLALRAARRLIAIKRPAAIFSTGGYVSVPICLAAARKGIPIVLHESDAATGVANRLIARLARHVTLGFPPSQSTNQPINSTVTGNPIRPEVTKGSHEEGLRFTGLSGTRPILLVLGGSQGAVAINEAIVRHLDTLTQICDVVHLTGLSKEIRNEQTSKQVHNHTYFSASFVGPELPHLYAIADLAVSRAGASFIAELGACTIPTILIPLRGVAHDHQERNARRMEKIGACAVLEQDGLDTNLVPMVKDFLSDSARCEAMKTALGRVRYTEAAGQIARIIAGSIAREA